MEFEEYVYVWECFYFMNINLFDEFQFKEIIILEEGELGLWFGFLEVKMEDLQFWYVMYRNKLDEEF